jgi:hypothetical protein
MELKAQAEAEKKEKERLERLKREEEERLERKKVWSGVVHVQYDVAFRFMQFHPDM